METLFFKEGDELCTPPAVGNDEVTAVCERRRKRGLGTWLAVALAVVVACAVLAFWRARSNAEPAGRASPGAPVGSLL